MFRPIANGRGLACLLLVAVATDLPAQKKPYDVFPSAEPPYYRVRYEASTTKGELPYAVNYTIWIPPGVKILRGVVVHQHGCGEGSCQSGLTGAYDLHWQALARKHDCALLSPAYEQPEKADCQMWCDPRNGSDAAFQKGLAELGAKSGHPELAKVPWALWGHSGGGHWAGGMALLHPDRVAAAWLRSGVPLLKADPARAGIKTYTFPDAARTVPILCNLGTKEGVTVKDRFAGVWPANEAFFHAVRGEGGLVAVAIDPLSSHECGNQRYLAIPWLDACLSARLPKVVGDALRPMPTDAAWLAPIMGGEATPAARHTGDPLKVGWLPNESIAKAWMEYVKDTKVSDTTAPPAPTNVRSDGNTLTWDCDADLESGLAGFIIERDGQELAKLPEQGKYPFGRPIFQNLQYSDTPTQPLVAMRFTDATAKPGTKHSYHVIAVNTVGLKSKPGVATANVPAEKRLPRDNLMLYRGADGQPRAVQSLEDWAQRRAEIVRGAESVMGKLPGREKKSALEPKLEGEDVDCGTYVRRLVTYQSEPGSRVPAYLLIPKGAENGKLKRPAVLCLHGTDNVVGHGTVVGLGKNPNRNYASELAERGYVCLAPNYPLLAKYQPEIGKLGWVSGTLKAVWDNIRGLDYLESLPFVDAKRLGAIGHSLGGHNAVYTALFDDRLKVVVSSCGLDSFLDYYGGKESNWEPEKGWCQTRYMRKLADYKGRLAEIPFDFHELVGTLAPRHVLIIAPKEDHNFQAASVDRIAAAAWPVFALHGQRDRLRVEHPDGGHDFPPTMREEAYTLFDAVLLDKPSGKSNR